MPRSIRSRPKAAADNPEIAAFIEECKNDGHGRGRDGDDGEEGHAARYLRDPSRSPATDVPLWVANFVLMGYGTGAVMAVPGHDERDWEFANKYDLPIVQVIESVDGTEVDVSKAAYVAYGRSVNSGFIDGMELPEDAFDAIADHFEKEGRGKRQVNFRLRDWGVSRQRYWGAPIPIIYCDDCGAVAVPEDQLPVVLPEDVEFTGVGSPLKDHAGVLRSRPVRSAAGRRGGKPIPSTRSSNRAGTSRAMRAPTAIPRWSMSARPTGCRSTSTPAASSTRFCTCCTRGSGRRSCATSGLSAADEPFTNLLTQGMVLKDGAKMSKNKGNTVDPQSLIDRYGADTVRTVHDVCSATGTGARMVR